MRPAMSNTRDPNAPINRQWRSLMNYKPRMKKTNANRRRESNESIEIGRNNTPTKFGDDDEDEGSSKRKRRTSLGQDDENFGQDDFGNDDFGNDDFGNDDNMNFGEGKASTSNKNYSSNNITNNITAETASELIKTLTQAGMNKENSVDFHQSVFGSECKDDTKPLPRRKEAAKIFFALLLASNCDASNSSKVLVSQENAWGKIMVQAQK